MKFIIGKKIEMSQVFDENGKVTPVTLVLTPPSHIVQIKTKENEGYCAVQIGAFPKKCLNKPKTGHLKDLPQYGILHEFRLNEEHNTFIKGKEIDITQFEEGDKVGVTGTSRGRGFQGVVKRHGFSGGPASHGHKDQLRMGGSIGAGGVQKVLKGLRMPGHMGVDTITVKNLVVVKIDKKNNILAIKGAVPGARNSLLYIESK